MNACQGELRGNRFRVRRNGNLRRLQGFVQLALFNQILGLHDEGVALLRLGLLELMVDLHLKTDTPEKAVPLSEALAAAR